MVLENTEVVEGAVHQFKPWTGAVRQFDLPAGVFEDGQERFVLADLRQAAVDVFEIEVGDEPGWLSPSRRANREMAPVRPPPSLPKKSQLFLPTAIGRRARSLRVLSISRPALVGVTHEGLPLIQGIRHGGGDLRLGNYRRCQFVEPSLELAEDRQRPLVAHRPTLIIRNTGQLSFQHVELPEVDQRTVSLERRRVTGLVEVASHVGPTGHFEDRSSAIKLVEDRCGIRLQIARIPIQKPTRRLAVAASGVFVDQVGADLLLPTIDPNGSLLRLARSRLQDPDAGGVRAEKFSLEHAARHPTVKNHGRDGRLRQPADLRTAR